jgi:transcriptional regulator with XRE-family HTH domain
MTSSAPATDVAAALRQAREGRGETVPLASERLHISAEYLDGLESDAPLTSYPSPTYARLFLKAYARYLELDPDPLLEAFAAKHATDAVRPEKLSPEGAKLPRQRVGRYGSRIPPPPKPSPPKRRRRHPVAEARTAAVAGFLSLWNRTGRDAGDDEIPDQVPVTMSHGRRVVSVRGRIRSQRVTRAAIVAVALLLVAGLLVGATAIAHTFVFASKPAPSPPPTAAPSPTPALTFLPRGGRTIFPNFRVVAFSGASKTQALGILGVGPADAATRLERQADQYAVSGRPVLPAMELIVDVASSDPGPDGKYRNRVASSVIDEYLAAARAAKMLLVLDLQPGRADFLAEAKHFQHFLEQPDVGLAIEPEWSVGSFQVPGKVLGSVDGPTVNKLQSYLGGLVANRGLPQKLFVVHQFSDSMVRDPRSVLPVHGVATVVCVDGYGTSSNKIAKYRLFEGDYRKGIDRGLKLYYRHDTDLMTPKMALGIDPAPDLVVYQ